MTAESGYVPDFLTIDVPLPLPREGHVVRQLDYTHFTVLLDPLRRLAAATAVNIDGATLLTVDRTDDWRLDTRVPDTEQAGARLYADNDLDRGHLVRRNDPVWGTPEIAARANSETFMFTNAAPQSGKFNQGAELWAGLKNFVLKHARVHRAKLSVFTGPVFDPADPVYRDIAIPRLFWKIAAWVQSPNDVEPEERNEADEADEADELLEGLVLAATAYVLDQTPQLDNIDLRTARALATGNTPPLGPFRTFQVPVADVGALTGLNLRQLVDADRLRIPATVRAVERADRVLWVPLETLERMEL